jgi:hypothetical protein
MSYKSVAKKLVYIKHYFRMFTIRVIGQCSTKFVVYSLMMILLVSKHVGVIKEDLLFQWLHITLLDQSVSRLSTGWTVRGMNPGGSEIFCTRPDGPWNPPSFLYNGYWGVALTTNSPSSAEFKERIELYFYSFSGPLWTVTGPILLYM